MANDSGSATAEQKSSALAYAGRSRIGGLALLDEPGGVCELRLESWLPQPAGVVIDSYTPGRGFSDQQVRGFFRYFHHTHTAVDEGNGCRYTDTVRFAGPSGPWVDRRILLGQMQQTFRARHQRMDRMVSVLT